MRGSAKRVAEAMLDNACSRISPKKDGNARRQARWRGLPPRDLRGEPTSGVFGDRRRSKTVRHASTRPDDRVVRERLRDLAAVRRRQ